jgi:hypothetical protein
MENTEETSRLLRFLVYLVVASLNNMDSMLVFRPYTNRLHVWDFLCGTLVSERLITGCVTHKFESSDK